MTAITNTKTGNVGTLVSRYFRTSDKKEIVEVILLSGARAYWLAAHCE